MHPTPMSTIIKTTPLFLKTTITAWSRCLKKKRGGEEVTVSNAWILHQSLDALRLSAEKAVGSRQQLDRWIHHQFSFIPPIPTGLKTHDCFGFSPTKTSTHLHSLHKRSVSQCQRAESQQNVSFTCACVAFWLVLKSHSFSVLQFYCLFLVFVFDTIIPHHHYMGIAHTAIRCSKHLAKYVHE